MKSKALVLLFCLVGAAVLLSGCPGKKMMGGDMDRQVRSAQAIG